jgi:ribosome-binding protein aMBF1 (putative translation factor)
MKTKKQSMENEVKAFLARFPEEYARQKAERQAYFDDPANENLIAMTRQRMAIAQELYNARKKAGLTQAELAEKMKVSQPMVARLERGRGNISCDTLLKYATACGCILTISMS